MPVGIAGDVEGMIFPHECFTSDQRLCQSDYALLTMTPTRGTLLGVPVHSMTATRGQEAVGTAKCP